MHLNARVLLRFFWILPATAALWTGWTFYSRYAENERLRQEALQKKRLQDQRTVEMMGGDRFEILHFYAMPGIVKPGEPAQLCYGVSNAKSVRLEPAAGRVWPSLNRCMEVSPSEDTTYTLTIEDAGGAVKKANIKLQVRAEP